jgi:hypothetical protein
MNRRTCLLVGAIAAAAVGFGAGKVLFLPLLKLFSPRW